MVQITCFATVGSFMIPETPSSQLEVLPKGQSYFQRNVSDTSQAVLCHNKHYLDTPR